jgi:AraC-like DNA-binding protein
MRTEMHPESIRFTSDRVGFDAFRVLVRELPDEDEAGTGRRGFSEFMFSCRPVREKGRSILTFRDAPEDVVPLNRITSLIPPNKPYGISWSGAAGKIVCCQIHSRFVEDVLRLTGSVGSGLRSVPAPRFVINRRVDSLCQLLMEETEQGCPSGRPYFEHLATALMIAVILQIDQRIPDVGNADAQQRRIQRAVALMETNFASKLTVDLLARASGLSAYHFSRLFHSVVGFSPHQYLLRCRLQHAKALLLKAGEGCTLIEVAAECGFADQAHLARHFRRAYGVSPSDFRKKPE